MARNRAERCFAVQKKREKSKEKLWTPDTRGGKNG
jgi:hypothetical protein